MSWGSGILYYFKMGNRYARALVFLALLWAAALEEAACGPGQPGAAVEPPVGAPSPDAAETGPLCTHPLFAGSNRSRRATTCWQSTPPTEVRFGLWAPLGPSYGTTGGAGLPGPLARAPRCAAFGMRAARHGRWATRARCCASTGLPGRWCHRGRRWTCMPCTARAMPYWPSESGGRSCVCGPAVSSPSAAVRSRTCLPSGATHSRCWLQVLGARSFAPKAADLLG